MAFDPERLAQEFSILKSSTEVLKKLFLPAAPLQA